MDVGIGTTGRATDKLSDKGIKAWLKKVAAAPASGAKYAKPKIADGGGLYLTVTRAGTPAWRITYRLAGKAQVYAVGTYPELGLADARAERAVVKEHLRAGRDPVTARRVARAEATASSAATFDAAADDWLAKQTHWAPVTARTARAWLKRNVRPHLGALPVEEITPPMVARVIEKVMARGAIDTAKKIRSIMVGIFRLAQVRGLCASNPAEAVREVLPKQTVTKHMPALDNFADLGDLLRRADMAPLSPSVRLAHKLCAFAVPRIGNVLVATWDQFHLDGDTPIWVIARAAMKRKQGARDFTVYLGPSITQELRQWRTATGGVGVVFPSPTGRGHITHEAVEKALRRTLKMDGIHSPHAWRASFSTLAHDAGFAHDVVELALDHLHGSAVSQAYDHGERRDERIRLVYWWDSQLTAAVHGGTTLPLARKAAGQ